MKYSLVLFILFFSTEDLYAQNFITHLYTTSDGLSDNYILQVYQDSYGYLWIGTVNGLNRFDGKNFIRFGLKQGLPSLFVDRIYEDHYHRLWIGTRGGMAEFRGDSCYTYPIDDNQKITFVSSFLETDSGKLWATTNKGLYEFQNNRWKKINLFPGNENTGISKIITTQKFLYVNYDNRSLIQIYSNGTKSILLSEHTKDPYYNSMYLINDSIYIGTYSGLLRWQQNKWQPLFGDALKKRFIYTTYHDKNNRWWFGTKEDGVLVAVVNNEKTSFIRIPLSFNLVSGFFEDRDGNIWVAGFQGLLKISSSYYSTIALPELDKMGFIRKCIELPSGKIIISGENGKLVFLKPDQFPQTESLLQLNDPGDFIDNYTFDESQKMWFTTRDNKLYQLDNGKLKEYTSIVACTNKIFRGIVYNKKARQLFVCGDSVLLTGNEHRLDTFFNRDKTKFIPTPSTIYLQENSGSMLVQTLDNGLFLVDSEGKILALNKDLNFSLSVAEKPDSEKNGMIIWAVYQGKCIAKYLWVNNNPPQLLETITEENGLPDNYIVGLAADKEGKLWVSTNKGIRLLQKTTAGKWVYQDMEINVSNHNSPFSFTTFLNDGEDNMWVNVQNKLVVFNAKKTTLIPAFTNTVIEKILLYNRPTDWTPITNSYKSYLNLPIDPVLKYNQNTLTFVFNSPQYHDNFELEYAYRLYPSDSMWSSPTSGNLISFDKLSAGEYKFEVRSHIKGFAWSTPAAFTFIIKKPFWETWWFRLCVIIAGAFVIILIFRYRLKQVKKKNNIQNQLREMEMKAFKLQMNPHFIHNALNSIQSLVINNKTNEASHYISKFAKLLRQVLESSDKNIISLEKELYSLQLYVELEKMRMNMEVEYLVTIAESVTESEIKIPPLVLQPFVENSFWHGLSQKIGEKKIMLSISRETNWLICQITDNGIGRKKAAETYSTFPEGHLSKAIPIIHQRLAEFNQSPGTEPVSFTDLEKNGEAVGTSVTVRIKIQ